MDATESEFFLKSQNYFPKYLGCKKSEAQGCLLIYLGCIKSGLCHYIFGLQQASGL